MHVHTQHTLSSFYDTGLTLHGMITPSFSGFKPFSSFFLNPKIPSKKSKSYQQTGSPPTLLQHSNSLSGEYQTKQTRINTTKIQLLYTKCFKSIFPSRSLFAYLPFTYANYLQQSNNHPVQHTMHLAPAQTDFSRAEKSVFIYLHISKYVFLVY